jgi:hypothetical protein
MARFGSGKSGKYFAMGSSIASSLRSAAMPTSAEITLFDTDLTFAGVAARRPLK